MVQLHVFDGIEAYMVVCEIEDDARHLSGATWIIETPEDFYPVITIYFTYASGHVRLQAAYAHRQ